MPSRTIIVSILFALLASVLTAGAYRHLHAKKAREVAQLRYENNQLRFQAYQNQQQQPGRRVSPSPAPAETPAKPKKASSAATESYRNEGQATPLASLQTFAWACDRGDTETVARMLHIDPSARTKADAYLSSLPDKIRNQWKSVDEMAAAELTIAIMSSPFPNADVLEAAHSESISEERIQFRLPGTRRDRTTFQKVGDVWQYVITEAMVDAYLQRNAKQAAPR